ncbi:MAG: YdhR family protein [Ottowia sp.]|nr:YdhR family protein [Ottowia sp.]
MITTVVLFRMPERVSVAQARALFNSTAPRYLGMPGLVRKYYILSEDGQSAGGVYLWQSRADAERVYTHEWREFVRGKYGSDPELSWFSTPVLVDNTTGEIAVDG